MIYVVLSKIWKTKKQLDLTTSSASRSNTSDLLRSSGCLTCSMNVCAPTASLRYGGNRKLSPYSSPAKTQQAQKAIDLSLCYATLTNSLKDSYSIVLPLLWMTTSSVSRHVSGQESPALVNSWTSRSSLKMGIRTSGIITGAAFVHLSAAYDTVNHIILTRKFFEITQDVRLTELIQNMLSNRRFYVDLVGKRSRWRRPEVYLSTSPLTSKDRRGLVNILKNKPGWLVHIIKHVCGATYWLSEKHIVSS